MLKNKNSSCKKTRFFSIRLRNYWRICVLRQAQTANDRALSFDQISFVEVYGYLYSVT